MTRRLIVASGNAHKIAELRDMVANARKDIVVGGMAELGAPPHIVESADTFVGNAILKARGIARWLASSVGTDRDWVMADDSGICVDALDGAPGVWSARFAGADASDEDNNAKLVAELKARGLEQSPAHYRCALAVATVGDATLPRPSGTEGRWVDGMVVFEADWPVQVRTHRRGEGGFGYDPHAWLEGEDRTVAELSRAEKAGMSHRGKATDEMLAWLRAV